MYCVNLMHCVLKHPEMEEFSKQTVGRELFGDSEPEGLFMAC
jgi:hypothetical protein